jgi:hypothetical protein
MPTHEDTFLKGFADGFEKAAGAKAFMAKAKAGAAKMFGKGKAVAKKPAVAAGAGVAAGVAGKSLFDKLTGGRGDKDDKNKKGKKE